MDALDELQEKVERLQRMSCGLEKRDFLATWDHDEDTLRWVLLASEILEDFVRHRISTRVFERGLGMSIFRDKSTRTRYAFKSACNLLGLATEELDEGSSQIGHGETTRETAAMIGFMTEVFGIRDDIHLGEGHFYMSEVAASLAEAHRAGALINRPTVVNLQSDLDHPTQALADLRQLSRVFGGLAGLRGRTIAVSWAYSPSYGKPLSVPQGVIGLLSRFGMHIRLAYPPGYQLADLPLEKAQQFSSESGGTLQVTHSMDDAFADADIVYPKSWAPYAVMEERTNRLRARRTDHLRELEAEALAQNAKYQDWTCSTARMQLTKNARALYMHCLPADITGVSCTHGEVDREVFEAARMETYKQASYKPFTIAALMLGMRVHQPAATLGRLFDAGQTLARKTRASTPPPPSSRRY